MHYDTWISWTSSTTGLVQNGPGNFIPFLRKEPLNKLAWLSNLLLINKLPQNLGHSRDTMPAWCFSEENSKASNWNCMEASPLTDVSNAGFQLGPQLDCLTETLTCDLFMWLFGFLTACDWAPKASVSRDKK